MVYCNSCSNSCRILFNILISSIVLFCSVGLSGCGSSLPAISSYKFIPKKGIKKPNPNYYLVLPSDTLIAIAMRLDLDYKLLAQYNHLSKPYTLRAGKRIRITKPPSNTYVARIKPSPRQEKATKKIKQYLPAPGSSTWIWPAQGKVQGKFRNKGIDIVAARNSAIKAVRSGEVVYAGNGLKGYGNLIILKHSNNFLSAYAHNEVLLVNEGDSVTQGTVIAKMGSSAAISVMLHFEIRKNGKPVNPLRYLPGS